jgi:hypothetical protein
LNNFSQKKPKILSSRLVVRPYLSWRYRLLIVFIFGLLLLILSLGMYEIGKQATNLPFDITEEKLASIYDPGTCRQTKKQKLCTQIGDLIQQLQITHTANDDLAKQIKSLTHENNHLKEKLVFFQHLMSGNTKHGISIHQFNLKEMAIRGTYRYTLTLTQGGERPSDFKGSLQFQVKLLQNDQHKTVPLVNKDSQQNFPLNFKFLHRFEENFKVPPGTTVESIQVQIYEGYNNKIILTQTIQPVL